MAVKSIESRISQLEQTLSLSNRTVIIWSDGDHDAARRNYVGEVKPSDRIVFIGWEDGHDIETEIPEREPDALELVEITTPVASWSKQNDAA
jgi:hypothetical protein